MPDARQPEIGSAVADRLSPGFGRFLRRIRIDRIAAIAAVGLAPIGLLGPLEWVWLLVLLPAIAASLAYPWQAGLLGRAGPLLLFVGYAAASLVLTRDMAEGAGILLAIAVFTAVYLAASVTDNPSVAQLARRIALAWTFGLSITLLLAEWLGDPHLGYEWDFPVRHAAMTLIATFALSITARRGLRLGMAGGVLAFAAAVATGARTASAVLLVVLIIAATLQFPKRVKATVIVGLLLAMAVALTLPGLQRRWFGEVIDDIGASLPTLSINVESRPDVWSEVADTCGGTWLTGAGLGTANVLAGEAHEAFPDPHNEVLRFGCDTGVAGSLLLWSFLVLALIRAVRFVAMRPGLILAMAVNIGLLALFVFSLVWNPLTSVEFTAPLAFLLGLADRTYGINVQSSEFAGASGPSLK